MEFIRSRKPALSLDMAPLIDVVFQLLIFFMLSSSFLSPVLKLNLPKAMTQDKRENERVVVTITKDGNFFVDRDPVAPEELQGTLGRKIALAPGKFVDLKGDADAAYRHFVHALDAARRAGASHINIVHEGVNNP
ncbi:MAG: hypothetical protein A3G91_00415 [Omnitrophica WOR_2 bacterium RIFCSPLOWO2_12_FULL_50_9]|nr:MAG: hypothetical protein A3D87_02465 [Omnitrophica WOR_2 bacterium RIFCSPHIGHO2_02_FULL_50_17]OGX40576.1 MAG: hypothetical protein A3G91_00415 [Omnitrophica WOR_2 bacterium RIFCSPLOWO2_12_FULL_50_9]